MNTLKRYISYESRGVYGFATKGVKCNSIEDLKMFVRELNQNGFKWRGNGTITMHHETNFYGLDTVYYLHSNKRMSYGNVTFSQENDIEVIEYKPLNEYQDIKDVKL